MIDTTKYFFNKFSHEAMAEEINTLAARKNVQVSRWVNNSKGRQIVTYKIHTGERCDFGSKQENVLFETCVDAGRGNKVRDETDMLNQIREYLNSIESDDDEEKAFLNISEKYGDPVAVTLADYLDLNPGGTFVLHEDGIYEDGEQVAERADA